MRRILAVTAALALAVPAAAQSMGGMQGQGNASASAPRPYYQMVQGYITKSAEQMPEGKYGYAPTAGVRSFGQIIGHVANSQYTMCAAAKGEESPSKEDFEKATSKADLVAALKASNAYCDGVYSGMSDAQSLEPVEIFGQKTSRLGMLIFNASHDWEHYGNLVTYLRMNGMVPPSSQGNGA